MSKPQYSFDIKMPQEVLTSERHDHINFKALEGKIIIGLIGYAKSGKDTITKTFIEDYGYHRVAFADNIKKEMNQYLKELVCKDINKRDDEEIDKLRDSGTFVDYQRMTVGQIDFFTEDLNLKKILRPYIIWYGEEMRNINGQFYWINKALSEDAKNIDKIILSDVRRVAELEIFKNSNEYKKRFTKSMVEAGIAANQMADTNNYGTLLFEVSQFGLTDSDVLTVEAIQFAHEQWLFDDTFFVDSRILAEGNYRQKAIEHQIKRIVKKFGIETFKKAKHQQTNIYQMPGVIE
jgi:hypothetical protein